SLTIVYVAIRSIYLSVHTERKQCGMSIGRRAEMTLDSALPPSRRPRRPDLLYGQRTPATDFAQSLFVQIAKLGSEAAALGFPVICADSRGKKSDFAAGNWAGVVAALERAIARNTVYSFSFGATAPGFAPLSVHLSVYGGVLSLDLLLTCGPD